MNNLVYFANKSEKGKSDNDDSISQKQHEKILEILANQAIKERSPNLDELESIIQNKLNSEDSDDSQEKKELNSLGGSESITKLLQEQGYLKDAKNWLTQKAFLEIGNKILHDVMNDLKNSDVGLHETTFVGNGNIVIDSTKKFELGDDIKFLSVSNTLLNSINRLAKTHTEISFPLDMDTDDLERFETLDDVKTAIVYCIDLSSTMKTILGNHVSRIEAAKKALWSLYVMNNKFFPNDSIFIVGFASMASQIKPTDIPFLKTFDANDNFLHYTNYQAAFRLARKILNKTPSQNKRIVLITDGQPSACFVDNEFQKNDILSDKPYSNFYLPDTKILEKIKVEKNMKLDMNPERLVYLCYRYKKVDPKIDFRTILEAKQCQRDRINIDTIVISDESELLDYAQQMEKELKGKTFHISEANMENVLVNDYLTNTRKVISSKQTW